MAARTSQEEQKRRRRKRLLRGLLLGGAAVGVPALVNALISRRSQRLTAPGWGRARRYAWKFGECAFQLLGEGRPVLLLHSFGPGHDSEEWRSVAEHLAAKHRIYALDLLGWGRSEKPSINYDDELYIQLIGDFLEDIIEEPAVLVGAGLSAAYAIQVAVDRPEEVRGLAVVVPSGIEIYGDEPDLKDALVHRMLRLPVLGTSALNLYTSRTALGQHLRRQSLKAAEQVDLAALEHYYRSSHQVGSHSSLAAYLTGYLNHRVDELLLRLTVPVWIAWGRDATSPAVETADFWVQKLPNVELEVFEDTGNLPHLEAPGRFSRPLDRFLNNLSN